MKILLADAIIDFYVNRKRFEAYKTRTGRMNYIYSILSGYLNSIVGTVVNGIEIRDVSITSNHFWGIEEGELCFPNDIGYSCSNELPPVADETALPVRIFSIDVVGLMETAPELQDQFFEVKNKNFILTTSSAKIV